MDNHAKNYIDPIRTRS